MNEFETWLRTKQEQLELALQRYLPAENLPPQSIHDAMRYSLFAGGKRVRPLLLLASGEALGQELRFLLPAACAVEMIHTYSLIHDDLPAMDNDDLRRGRPTSHKVFGEALAILAGDALLTRAFEILSRDPEETAFETRRLKVLRLFAEAAGTAGIIGGQVLDLEAEGKSVDEEGVLRIHRGKTGALIRASVLAGGILAAAAEDELLTLENYAVRLGLAFQIVDDILDVVETSSELGKTAGKDERSHKATYPQILGLEGARRRARELIGESVDSLAVLGERARTLREIAEFVYARHH